MPVEEHCLSHLLAFLKTMSPATKSNPAVKTHFRGLLSPQADMPADEFDEHRESLIDEKLQKDHALREESDRFWEQIWEPRSVLSCFQL